MNQAKCNLKAAENFPSYLNSYLRNRNEAYFTGFSVFFIHSLGLYRLSPSHFHSPLFSAHCMLYFIHGINHEKFYECSSTYLFAFLALFSRVLPINDAKNFTIVHCDTAQITQNNFWTFFSYMNNANGFKQFFSEL